MASFSAAEVIERFRSAGVQRSAFGQEDIRTWFGAIPDVRANVLESAAYLRGSGLLDPSVKVHGLILDSQTGAAELIANGYDAAVYASVARSAEREGEAVEAPPTARDGRPESPPPLKTTRHEERTHSQPAVDSARRGEEQEADDAVAQALSVVEYLLKQAQGSPDLGRVLPRITDALRQEKNPVRIVNLIERSIRDYGVLNPGAAERFEQVRKIIRSRPDASTALLELVRKLTA